MQEKKRRLKVYKKTRVQYKKKGVGAVIENVTEYKELPAILLSGEWLVKAGYNIGDNISVEITENGILISNTSQYN